MSWISCNHISRMTQKAIAMDIECTPLIFSSMIKKKWIDEEKTSLPKICHYLDRQRENQLLLLFYNQVHPTCRKLCTTMNYEGNLELSQEEGLGKNTIGLSYWIPTNELEVQKQYLIYDFYGLIGFIGGTLGLFIGFSFYESFICFFDVLRNLIRSIVEKFRMK